MANSGQCPIDVCKGAKIENYYICVFNPDLVAKGNVKAEANRSAKAAAAM